MKSGTRDETEGKRHQVKGKVKGKVKVKVKGIAGKLGDHPDLEGSRR